MYNRIFEPGTYKIECAVCGFDFLRSELIRRWDGVLVCEDDYEAKDAQLEKRTHRERVIVDEILNNDSTATA